MMKSSDEPLFHLFLMSFVAVVIQQMLVPKSLPRLSGSIEIENADKKKGVPKKVERKGI